MKARVSNWTAATAGSLVLAALAGCSGAQPDSAPPPPPPATSYERPQADLAGAPAPAPPRDGFADGLAGGYAAAPPPPPGPALGSMAPIPNPEDLPLAERHRIYGTAYDGDRPAARQAPAPAPPHIRPHAAATARPGPVRPVARPAAAQPVPPAETAVTAPTAASGGKRPWFDLSRLDLGVVDVPGVGRMRSETVIGGGLLLLALLSLVAIARNLSEAEARALRRRKQRAMADGGEQTPDRI